MPRDPRRPDDPPVERPGTTLLRAAVQPRMIGLLLLLLLAAAVCGRLGVWQLDRAQERGAQNERAAQAALSGAAPLPIADVLAPRTSFSQDMVGRRVVVSGTFDAEGQLLVRHRARDGRTGYLVLTPLRVAAGGSATGGEVAVLPVVRGWIASAEPGPGVLDVPAGVVDVTGFLQASEAAGSIDQSTRQADAISSAQLVNVWGGPIYSGYLVVSQVQPPQSTELLALQPPVVAGAGLNLQNLAYAAQWWIFGGFAVFLWIRLVRDEAAGGTGPVRRPPAVAAGP